MKQVWQTIDGRLFDSEESALASETELIDDWVRSSPSINGKNLLEIAEDKAGLLNLLKSYYAKYLA